MSKELEKFTEIEQDIQEIRENHLPHLQEQIVRIQVDVSWLKRFFFIIAGSSIGSAISSIANLLK